MFNTADAEYHRKSRRMLASAMSDTAIQKLSTRVGGHVNFAVDKMKAENSSRKVIDIYKWWLFMATDIIVEFTYGESFHMLEHGKRNGYSFFLEHSGMFGIYRSVAPLFTKLFTLLPFDMANKLKQSSAAMSEAASKGVIVHQKTMEDSRGKAEDDVRTTFFGSLFREQKDGSFATQDTLISEGRLYIAAGSDTTANTLTYLIWGLCRHPLVKSELVAALQELPEDYTDHDLRRVDLLNRCIKEALRLYSAIPESFPRLVPQGGTELCGYGIEEGTVVATQPYSMHRDPDVFQRPEEFDPSRWIDPSPQMADSYMPFGRGSRSCIGLNLAYAEIRLGTARFLRTFPNARVSTLEGMSDTDMNQTSYFILSPKTHRCLIEVD